MDFGTALYNDLVSQRTDANMRPCKPLNSVRMESLPYGKFWGGTIYADPSAILALLKNEQCAHTKSGEVVAKVIDVVETSGGKIIISSLAENQVYPSIVLRNNYHPKDNSEKFKRNYFHECISRMKERKDIFFFGRDEFSEELCDELSKSDEGILMRERIEDFIHVYIARKFKANAILTYDLAFAELVRRPIKIERGRDGMSIQFEPEGSATLIGVMSPEMVFGNDFPCAV